MNIFGALLGMGFVSEPQRNKERIVFICLLFTCTIFSGFFHSMLTIIDLQKSPEVKMDTLEDLANSNFTLWTMAAVLVEKSVLATQTSITLQKLVQNSQEYISNKYNVGHCLNDLAKYKNITCSVASHIIPIEYNRLVKDNQNLDLKIIEEKLTYYAVVYLFAARSPLIDKFNQLLVKFTDVGLMSKWSLYYSHLSKVPSLKVDEGNQSSGLFVRMLLFLECGYILAITAFIIEVVYDIDTRKKVSLNSRRCAQIFYERIKKCCSETVTIFLRMGNILRAAFQKLLLCVNNTDVFRHYFHRR